MNAADAWLIVGVRRRIQDFRRELHVKSSLFKTSGVKLRKYLMPVHRRRFRIEEAVVGDMPMPIEVDGEVGPMHREIMSELRAIRAQMAAPGHSAAPASADGASTVQEVAEAQALLETYRAQIVQCEKLKVEL